MTPRSLLVALALAAATLPLAAATTPACTTPDSADDAEVPCNPHLADSAWGGNHRNSYAQASSHLPGVTGPADTVNVDHESVTSVPVIVSFSPPYPDGERVLWASTVGFTGEVVKIDTDTMTTIDKYVPQLEEGRPPAAPSVSGAYNLVDADNRLHVGTSSALEVYGDAVPGERTSSIALLRRFELPDEALCGDDRLVGLTMTYDGHLAFATENGVVGVLPRDPDRMSADALRTLQLGPGACDGSDPDADVVSNSIAADEDGGIYVVTSQAMYRVDWDGSGLGLAWRAPYAGAGGSGGGRLGPGSGSTPSLMGTAPDDDRFVVLTDGQELMHLVLMWRDEIPADWEPVRPDADPRIACEIPVTFGDADATRSLSEQSVLVRGHSAMVVNNLQALDPVYGQFPPALAPFTQFLSGMPGNAPAGLEKFSWDPDTRTCDVDWANPEVSIPNGIPTMSAATNMVYGIGARDGVWTLEGLDWDTGESVLTVEASASPTANSTYAATTVGHDGTVWTGTFGGVTRFATCDPDVEQECGRRTDPVESVLGTFPTEPQALARDLVGLPNDETAAGAPDAAAADDGAPDDGAPDDGTTGDGQDDAVAGAPLPATGGGATVLALAATGLAAGLRRRRP